MNPPLHCKELSEVNYISIVVSAADYLTPVAIFHIMIDNIDFQF